MTLCNINKYVSKCYLKFFKIVLAEIGSNPFSYAFKNVRDGVLKYKKNYLFSFT